jgi:hypothetical protein
MTRIPPMSSTIASASRKIFKPVGTLGPRSAMIPTAIAMSVAIGIPQPLAPSPPALNPAYSNAGTAMPPTAPATGSNACRGCASSPSNNSRLISSPTTKKKTVISPSFTKCARSPSTKNPEAPTWKWSCQKSK